MEQTITIKMNPEELALLMEQSVTRALKGNGREEIIVKDDDELLTVQQAAEFLKLAKPTIYSLVSRGELPSMKRSKRLYFSRRELVDYLKAGRRISWRDVIKA